MELLFARFDETLRQMGLEARKGQIMDASLVSVPIQRNSREENRQIREDNPPQEWSEAKARIGLCNLAYNLQGFTYLVTQVYVWA